MVESNRKTHVFKGAPGCGHTDNTRVDKTIGNVAICLHILGKLRPAAGSSTGRFTRPTPGPVVHAQLFAFLCRHTGGHDT